MTGIGELRTACFWGGSLKSCLSSAPTLLSWNPPHRTFQLLRCLIRGQPVFDSIGAFAKQFTPIDGGYLYSSSTKGGGKLVTADEYEQLIEGWRKVAGRRGLYKVVGIVTVLIVVWTAISGSLLLPDWSNSVVITATGIATPAWLFWASLAPYRLVRNRPAIAPPRPVSEAKRQARALLNWRFIVFALLFSGVAFLLSINLPERDFKSWAWPLGSGLFFVSYLWIAIQKFRDS